MATAAYVTNRRRHWRATLAAGLSLRVVTGSMNR
jgi:hypothetical protein